MSEKLKVRIGGIHVEAEGGRAVVLGAAIAFAALGLCLALWLGWTRH